MHGHFVVISSKELETIDESVTVQLALINEDASQPSIIVVDRIRLTTLTFVHTPASEWWSPKQGPCPITQPNIFAAKFDEFSLPNKSTDSIFKLLTKRQDVFNGIGTSHANEILHLAMEHPAQKASIVFNCNQRRAGLKQAIAQFFDFANSTKYQKSIPAGKSGGSAFSEPHYLTKNIISMQQRVYGHTKSPTKITKAHYEELFRRGLLEDKYQALGTLKHGRASRDSSYQSKRVEVYAIRFLVKNKKTDELRDGQYAYTVMCKAPSDCVPVRYESREKARRQALGSRSAEIGIASFMDNANIRKFEKTAVRRRFPVKSGRPGRPRKSKNSKFEATFAKKALPSDDPEMISRKRRKTWNKDLVDSDASSSDSVSLDILAVASSENDSSVYDSSVYGEGEDGRSEEDEEDAMDGEDAERVLDEAVLIDEASSGEDEDDEEEIDV